jgi:hypothetical protein
MAYPMQPITFTASATLTKKAHQGTMLNLSAAAGLTITLPASSGDGAVFRFFVRTTITSNNYVIQVANATDVMQGTAISAQDAADTAVLWETAATSDTITLNGTTKGGIIGDYIELEDAIAGFWSVRLVTQATGTEVTPFSAAVS